jgi:hypothetical protein
MAFTKGETQKKDITTVLDGFKESHPDMAKREIQTQTEVIRTGKRGRPRRIAPKEAIRITLDPESKRRFVEWCEINGTNPSVKAREILVKFINSQH